MRRRGEEQATDIKSNNPHLAGGEKILQVICFLLCFGDVSELKLRADQVMSP